MNYYEHHLGDYAEATAHLSFVEDAAYSRMIRKYYSTERPLPADVKSVQRIVGARTEEEKEAVETVLNEFFTLLDDGWHNDRCDDEIARFKDKQAKAKRSADARWEKSRQHTGRNANALQSDCEGNAHQTPDTSHQTPEGLTHASGESTGVTPAGSVCVRLRREALMPDCNPQHPKLLALLDAGLTEDEIVSAGVDAVAKGKGFAYALATAEGRRREAAKVTALPAKAAVGNATKAGQRTADAAQRWLESQGAAQ